MIYSPTMELAAVVQRKKAAAEVFTKYSENQQRSLNASETYAAALGQEMALRRKGRVWESFDAAAEITTVVAMQKSARHMIEQFSQHPEIFLPASRVCAALNHESMELMKHSPQAVQQYLATHGPG